jgi:putative YphP/YqiW family bacilliredoxin
MMDYQTANMPPEMALAVQAMRDELTNAGVRELRTGAEVDEALAQREGTTLLVVNSVCGCAASAARPGIVLSLLHSQKPDHSVSVFAGQDKEATERARGQMPTQPASSPSVFLFKNGELVFTLHRHQIQGYEEDAIAQALKSAYDEFCA